MGWHKQHMYGYNLDHFMWEVIKETILCNERNKHKLTWVVSKSQLNS